MTAPHPRCHVQHRPVGLPGPAPQLQQLQLLGEILQHPGRCQGHLLQHHVQQPDQPILDPVPVQTVPPVAFQTAPRLPDQLLLHLKPPPVLFRLPGCLEPFLPDPPGPGHFLHLGKAGQEAAVQQGDRVEWGGVGLLQAQLLLDKRRARQEV